MPALVDALGENDAKDKPESRVSLAAAVSLGRIGPAAREALPALLELAKKGDDLKLQIRAIGALGAIGDQAEAVVPALLAAVKDPKVRGIAVRSLGRMGPKRAKEIVPALLKALDVSDMKDKADADLAQFNAIFALVEMGPAARVAVPKIEEILKDPNSGFQARLAAERALEKLRP